MDQATVAVFRRAFESAGVEFLEENGGGPGQELRKRQQRRKDNGLKTEAAPADEDLGHGVELRTAGYSCRIPVDPTFRRVLVRRLPDESTGPPKVGPGSCVRRKTPRDVGSPLVLRTEPSLRRRRRTRGRAGRAPAGQAPNCPYAHRLYRPSWVSTVVVALDEIFDALFELRLPGPAEFY
jgi:hypothetical protein